MILHKKKWSQICTEIQSEWAPINFINKSASTYFLGVFARRQVISADLPFSKMSMINVEGSSQC
jgi:hypothetical protein